MKRKKKDRGLALKPFDPNRPACEWRWPRVGLYIPSGANSPASCTPSHRKLQSFHRLPEVDTGRGMQMDMKRTRACEAFLKAPELTHLLMLDDDHIHPLDVPGKLARWCFQTRGKPGEVEVVGGLNFGRPHPHKPCCFLDDPEAPWDTLSPDGLRMPLTWGDGLLEVAIAGTGSLMIARTALEKCARPFFPMPTEWNTPDASEAWPGEDVGFAQNCRRSGVKQFVDTTCTSPHLSERFITAADFDPAVIE